MSQHHVCGFTLIEMIVVISIILAIAGISMPLMKSSQEASRRDATRALITAISAAIAERGAQTELVIQSDAVVLPLWDINSDGLLDGNLVDSGQGDVIDAVRINDLLGPAAGYSSTQIRNALAKIGYNGFPATTGFATRAAITGSTGRILDPWKRPLRYAYAPVRRSGSGAHVLETRWVALISDADIRSVATTAAAGFGPRGFAIWSAGRDGIDGTSDDIATFPLQP